MQLFRTPVIGHVCFIPVTVITAKGEAGQLSCKSMKMSYQSSQHLAADNNLETSKYFIEHLYWQSVGESCPIWSGEDAGECHST